MSKLVSKVVEEPANKQLRIQLGICKRLIKEVSSYEIEVIKNESRVQKMRDDGKDSYDIRKQEEVLQESYMMIPDSKNRLEKSIHDLHLLLMDIEGNNKVEGELIKQAKEIVNTIENTPSIANYSSSSHSSIDNKVINNKEQILIEDDNSDEPL